MLSTSTIRIVAVMLLVTEVLGALFNQYFVGPVIFAKDFLTSAASNDSRIITGVLLSVVDGITGLSIAILLWPLFKTTNRFVAALYIGLSLIGFVTVLIDDVAVLTILGLSREYVKTSDSALQSLSVVFFQTRWWTHYITLLMAGPSFTALNVLLFQSRLVPRFISVWGIIGAGLLMIEIVLSMYGKPTNMLMLMPFGLQQLVLIVWLLIRPASNSAVR
ncbi:MAG: DUF4386 domain-containing protein [Cyclobacteriaceae bacterium]|nr:hypothetical protein [Cytophagales bacterium]HNP76779.1 DUF4386 domain-containing protein [Cyclobacteriaceae bacterium]